MTQRSCNRCDCLSAARMNVTICSHSSRWQTEKSIKRRKKVHSMFVIQTIRDNFARAIVHFVVSSLLQLQLIKINAADALRTVHTHNPKPNTASKHIHVQCSCSQWRARTKRDCNEFEWICELEILFKFWFSISAAFSLMPVPCVCWSFTPNCSQTQTRLSLLTAQCFHNNCPYDGIGGSLFSGSRVFNPYKLHRNRVTKERPWC